MADSGEGPRTSAPTETRHETSDDRSTRAPDSPGGGQEAVGGGRVGPDSPGGGQEEVEAQLRRDPVSPGGGKDDVGGRGRPDSAGGGQESPAPDPRGRRSA
jgi:hypothetical protein